MKMSFKHLVFSTMLLALTVSCGGSKSKGGGNSVDPLSAYNYGTNLTSGSSAYTSFLNWTDATETQSTLPAVQLIKLVYSMSSCTTKSFLGIPYQYCSAGNSTPTPETSIVSVPANQARKLYPSIASILTPEAGYVLINVETQGNNIYVYHVQTSSNKLIKYTIDTTLHAALNPRVEENSITSKAKVLNNY